MGVVSVLALVGRMLLLFAALMGVPLAFEMAGPDLLEGPFLQAMGVTALAGLALSLSTRRFKRELQPRDGFLLVSLTWLVLPAFGALPLMLALPDLSFTDAYFEAMSGLTSTCGTVLTGLDQLPLSINVWRCFMALIGGMGVIVLVVAILPLLGVGAAQLFNSEAAGPIKDQKLTPRMADTARGLWTVYFSLFSACLLAYRGAGMSWADAFMHACTTVSLAGFSSYDASFGAFNSAAIEAVAVVFMMLAGINYSLYFLVWRKRSVWVLLRDIEARAFVVLMVAAVTLVAGLLTYRGVYPSFGESLRHAGFNVVSVATTTGFASVDYALWPMFAPVLMMALCCFSTCAGSTGGGIKLVRSLLLQKQALRELTRIVHPRAVTPVTLGGSVVPARVMSAVMAFMLIYGFVLTSVAMLLLLSGLDVVTAFTAAVACINNTGPGLGQVGPAGNYQGLTDFQTWVCSAAMLLGRLEMLSVLVLFTPQFWRK